MFIRREGEEWRSAKLFFFASSLMPNGFVLSVPAVPRDRDGGGQREQEHQLLLHEGQPRHRCGEFMLEPEPVKCLRMALHEAEMTDLQYKQRDWVGSG